jgi:hypothetical protein
MGMVTLSKKESTITEMQAGNSANYMKQQFKKKKTLQVKTNPIWNSV